MPTASVTPSILHPLTYTQSDIWLDQNVHTGSTQFNLCTYYVMDFALEVDCFVRAAEWVFSHYDALYARMTQGMEGMPEMYFDPANAIQCERADLSGVDEPNSAKERFLKEFAHKPFTILEGPLSRMTLIKYGVERYVFAITFHHITVDGWGTGAVITRISEAYEALKSGGEPKTFGRPFAAYLDEFKTGISDTYREKAAEFWKPMLSRQAPTLPATHRTEGGLDKISVNIKYFTLPRETADQLSALASTFNATLYHVLLLALNHLVTKTYKMDPLFLEMPVLNRGKEDKETIGIFIEPRYLSLPVEESASVGDNLNAISKRVRELFRHYRMPLSDLDKLYHEAGNTGRARSPFVVSYVTRDFGGNIDGHFVPLKIYPQAHQAIPVTLYVLDTYPDRDIRIEFLHQKQYFNTSEACLFEERFLHLLEALVDKSDCKLEDIDILPPAEKRLIHSMLSRKEKEELPTRPIICNILEVAAKSPNAIAVEDGEKRITYGECVGKAYAIARELVENHGVKSGDLVPLLLPRGEELIESELALLMTGAAFVPLEIANPEMRLRQIAEDCAPKCVVTSTAFQGKAAAISANRILADTIHASAIPFVPLTKPEDTAYVIYTSGSTGKPKGVEIPNLSLSQHIASIRREISMRHGAERSLLFASPSFDASIDVIYRALLSGSTIVTAPHPQWTAYELPKQIIEKQLTFIDLPPAFAMELLKHLRDNPEEIRGHKIRICVVGGDVLHAETAKLWDDVFGPDARIVNIYGPTEITVDTTCFIQPFGYRPDIGESIPIGHVYEGRSLRILDERGRDQPIGVEGELYIGGISLARGYHNMPEETAKRFVTLDDGKRYYRSGDIVKLRSDGEIIFRRRMDTQVKIRGFRVETSEIEACLMSEPNVRECGVLAVKNETGAECELKAFVALKHGAEPSTANLRSYLEERLPNYMIPHISVVESLPKSDAGKINRKALLSLQELPQTLQNVTNETNRPHGVVQEYLAFLWEKTLGSKVCDTQMDFFELGGHSLLAAKLVATIGKSFRVEYPFPSFFEKSSIADTERKLTELMGNHAKVEKIAALRLELAKLSPEEIQARLDKIKTAQK